MSEAYRSQNIWTFVDRFKEMQRKQFWYKVEGRPYEGFRNRQIERSAGPGIMTLFR